ncbi:hypothetical protein SB749_14810 [Brevibacterium sp. SIMBA_078]|uniref:hypothetical protein n=1 Tax=Brevibacterium sp. SIMBA_078 TaxID=3085816 RepID=UPI00397BC3D9
MENTETPAVDRPVCFVISPIGAEGSESRKQSDTVLKHLIRKSLGSEYEVVRGDEEVNPGSITSRIVSSILEADLIVADLSGFNPNVYYEVAIAHGYEKPTVHIQRDDESPAFDLKDMRLVRYDTTDPEKLEKAQTLLSNYSKFAVGESGEIVTPLSDAKRFIQLADSVDPVAQSNFEVIEQLSSLRAEVRRAFSPIAPRRKTPIAKPKDISSLIAIINNASNRGVLEASDFASVINSETSTSFDKWVKKRLSRLIGDDDDAVLDEILVDLEDIVHGGVDDSDVD